MVRMLEECGGLSRIEELQKNGSKGVYERAASILEGLAGCWLWCCSGIAK